MSRRRLIKACVLLAVTSHATAQYIDFFQSFNSFLQPYTTTKPRNDATKRPASKHRQTNKQKQQDIIFFEDDVIKQKETAKTLDPFNFYSTTTKPRRKSTKTSTSQSNDYTTSSPKIDKNINNNRLDVIRSIDDNTREQYIHNDDTRNLNSGRRVDSHTGYNVNYYNTNSETSNKPTNSIYAFQNNYNTHRQTTTTDYYNNVRQTTPKPIDIYKNPRQTTQRTNTDYSNNYSYYGSQSNYSTNRQTTQRTTDYYNSQRQTNDYYNSPRQTTHRNFRPYDQTTSNPLLNRPGVIPAVVNDNKPPITNRPVTARPVYDSPFDTGVYRPANTRPPYEERTTKRPLETRPANTRPPYEIERPVSGIHRPISSGVRPGSSGVRPGSSGIRPGSSGIRPGTSTVSDTDAEPDIEIGPDEDDMSESEKRRLYDICEQKCEEYKSSRVKKVVALPLSPNSQGVELNVSSCSPTNIPLIIGGVVVKIEQFPHMALVGWKKIQNGGYSWKCGGSLVSEQYILTAGHCTYHDKDYNVVRYNGPPHAVQLGSSLYNDRSATIVQITAVIRHPKYKLRRSYYDVALIKLVSSVTFSEKISPACLGVPPSVGEPIVATGWGKTEFGGDSSIELRSVSIPVWAMDECRDIWGTSLKLPQGPAPDSQICAGERKGAKDTCQGDSGGPAQVADGCAWRVVAVTSVGRSCGAPQTPALYARVPRAFIAKQVYTNAKSGRDGNEQYGNAGIINENVSNNWGSGNINNDYMNKFGNQGVANNDNYNSGRAPNTGQNFGEAQTSNSDNRDKLTNHHNVNTYNNQQTTRKNEWSVPISTNDKNSYGQNDYVNDNNYRTTTIGYNQNNFGQNGYTQNNFGQNGYGEQNQNGPNTEYVSDIRNYGTQNSGYNDNGQTGNSYRGNDNVYNSYAVANRPWWNR